ncbi:hypothetical protein XMV201_002761 [Aliiroseovarius sp. xm-v-201]|nr:hypothetical protein [Aliiroseovarius sp. xm-m-314]NRP45109.1 hypothetical protein [Aliiroseovarius sp. xm-m-378]NRP50987.1 hypothetical protein [Aliiroseovarius sp. xm-m-354]NRP65980.1 hypothetical protein [Aliiroseovarius sp. xm-v-225]NRP80872.1 hypothetical protein [Aliiroseovarius sp. xm-v-209]NRP92796.1 hypothetical protein [Aliiroseovarius sp. xm-a-134]NRQ05739.1 hypothetical protein [Aliiroseovarius sp. xm-m-309]NRQ08943.1 hypothetical protein [Aliiroseovarius sp. xm-v-201]NRQ1188
MCVRFIPKRFMSSKFKTQFLQVLDDLNQEDALGAEGQQGNGSWSWISRPLGACPAWTRCKIRPWRRLRPHNVTPSANAFTPPSIGSKTARLAFARIAEKISPTVDWNWIPV